MKKTLWMLGVAVAALTSCTQNEVLDVPESKLIAFDSFVDKPTRAVDDVLDDVNGAFKEFYVFCKKGQKDNNGTFTPEDEFVLEEVKVTGGKTHWTYTPHASWASNKTFRFAAYANGNANGDATAAKLNNVVFKPGTTAENKDWGLTITNYEVSDNDLVVAIPEEKEIGDITTAPGSVGLTFKHILSKVEFRFTYTNGSADQKLIVEEFGFDAAKSGNCETKFTGNDDSIGADWTPNPFNKDDNNDYVYFPSGKEWTSGNVSHANYVIPQSNESLVIPKITIKTIKISTSEVTDIKTYTNIPLMITGHTNWLPGYVYRYTADITPGEHYIHFTTSVRSWKDEDNRNQTIQNGN